MKIERLQAIVYAEGFVEDFIEYYVEGLAEPARATVQIEQLQTMWGTLSDGLTELRRENADLELKIFNAQNALT